MVDRVSPAVRSKIMSRIRGKNTKPEVLVRSELHRLGFRFRIHDKKLPGSPDIVLKKYQAVIFVHGCFWHRHQCRHFKWPSTNSEFWRKKINKNWENDMRAIEQLSILNWRVCIVWECALSGGDSRISQVIDQIANWLDSREKLLDISE